MAANNQGIMHLATKQGGFPVCRNKRAHMSTDSEQFARLPLQCRCKKCQATFAKWEAKRAKSTAAPHKTQHERSDSMKYVLVKHSGTDGMVFWCGRVVEAWSTNEHHAAIYNHEAAAAAVMMARACGASTVFMVPAPYAA